MARPVVRPLREHDGVLEEPGVRDPLHDTIVLVDEDVVARIVVAAHENLVHLGHAPAQLVVIGVHADDRVVAEAGHVVFAIIVGEIAKAEPQHPRVALAQGDVRVHRALGGPLRRHGILQPELEPVGGRRDQIRVHVGEIGLPGRPLEAEILVDVEGEQVSRSVRVIAGLQRVVYPETHDV